MVRIMAERTSKTPSDLLWLRRLATLCAPITIYSFARAYRMTGGNFGHFDLVYPLALLPLLAGVVVSGWLGRFRAFVLLAILDRAIAGFGALLYFLRFTVPGSPHYSLRHPGFITWNLFGAAISAFIIVHLFRKYPPSTAELSATRSVPAALRVIQGGFLLLVVATWIDKGADVGHHLVEEGSHWHSCNWLMMDLGMAAMMAGAFVAGLLGKWRVFVALGLVSAAQMAFCNLFDLRDAGLYERAWGTLAAPVSLSRNLVVLAFSVFTMVYLARRFPPEMGRGEAA